VGLKYHSLGFLKQLWVTLEAKRHFRGLA
jgi:hypothetical protein